MNFMARQHKQEKFSTFFILKMLKGSDPMCLPQVPQDFSRARWNPELPTKPQM